jgi:histidine ammonia-lyase
MSNEYQISTDWLGPDDILAALKKGHQLKLSEESRKKIVDCRHYLEQKLVNSEEQFYGINTGFGSLCNIIISKEAIHDLQHNLVKSHACGTGDLVPQEIVRLILLLKIKNLAQGYSGVRLELVERLIFFYNEGILPVIYQLGSLGASGDLAPLAHLSLPLIGLGEVYYEGEIMDAGPLLRRLGVTPLELEAKEGLALLNGTQFSSAYCAWILVHAHRLFRTANLCAALSLDAFDCRMSPFDERLHIIRHHEGQQKVAASILNWLEDSPIASGKRNTFRIHMLFVVCHRYTELAGMHWHTLQMYF